MKEKEDKMLIAEQRMKLHLNKSYCAHNTCATCWSSFI